MACVTADDVDSFVRVRRGDDALVIEVREITWDGQTPVESWAVVRLMELSAFPSEVEAARTGALQDAHYFGTCSECGERCPRGWMEGAVCQGCLEANHRVVF